MIDMNAITTIINRRHVFRFVKYTLYTTHTATHYWKFGICQRPFFMLLKYGQTTCVCVCVHAACFSLRESSDRTISLLRVRCACACAWHEWNVRFQVDPHKFSTFNWHIQYYGLNTNIYKMHYYYYYAKTPFFIELNCKYICWISFVLQLSLSTHYLISIGYFMNVGFSLWDTEISVFWLSTNWFSFAHSYLVLLSHRSLQHACWFAGCIQ